MHSGLFSVLQSALAYLGLASKATGGATEKALDAIFAQAAALNPKLWAQSSADTPTRQAKFERFALALAVYMARASLTPNQRRDVLEGAIERLAIGLREAGVGDMAVSKEIRTLAGALHGRLKIYENLILNNIKADFIKAVHHHSIPKPEAVAAWESAAKAPSPTSKAAPKAAPKAAGRNKGPKKHLRLTPKVVKRSR